MIIHKQLKYCCLCDFCMHMLFMLVYVFIFCQKLFRAYVKMLFQCRIKIKLLILSNSDLGFHNRILNKMSSLTYNSNRTRVHFGGISLKLPCSKLLGSNVHDNHMHAGSKQEKIKLSVPLNYDRQSTKKIMKGGGIEGAAI